MTITVLLRRSLVVLSLGFVWSVSRSFFVAADVPRGFSPPPAFTKSTAVLDSLRKSVSTLSTNDSSRKSYRVIQVQIVHRHGDRTPITPLKNETYWASTLPQQDLLEKLDSNTRLIRDKPNIHKAGGRGPFGKLTQLGLMQMVELGSRLHDELCWEEDGHAEDGNVYLHHGRLFYPSHPLHPRHVQVISTDFPRTIQSVQGVLVGLFPTSNDIIDIDVRHTSTLIPDPQPRRSREQEELELQLAARPHLLEREAKMKDLALRTTQELLPLLGEGAFDVSFGVGEEKNKHTSHHHHLAWTQLSEITKCLAVRDLLPPTISLEDQEAISSYAAWKWMENLRHPRLAYLSMHPMMSRIIQSMQQQKDRKQQPSLILYSAHDSTLIGLLCAFRLEQPAKWPSYGEYLKMELVEVTSLEDTSSEKQYYVRFSLSGKVLRSQWDDKEEPLELISLDQLAKHVHTVPHKKHEHSFQ